MLWEQQLAAIRTRSARRWSSAVCLGRHRRDAAWFYGLQFDNGADFMVLVSAPLAIREMAAGNGARRPSIRWRRFVRTDSFRPQHDHRVGARGAARRQ
jgi:hypothetical protein